jgi:hypothetical protein
MARLRNDVAKVRCPYCFEKVELFVDPDTHGSYVEDCAVCCHPWTVVVERDGAGGGLVEVIRAQ